jgi:hypothetical protein
MDRRRFLLTSLAGAAPAHLLVPAAAGPREPNREPSPAADSYTNGEMLRGLANEFQVLIDAVEGYSRLMLQKMDEVDPLRRAPVALLPVAERLRGLTGSLRAIAGGVPPRQARGGVKCKTPKRQQRPAEDRASPGVGRRRVDPTDGNSNR